MAQFYAVLPGHSTSVFVRLGQDGPRLFIIRSFVVARQKPNSTRFRPATQHRPSYASVGLGRVYS